MDKRESDLQRLEEEVDIAFRNGIGEFRVETFADKRLTRALEIKRYFECAGAYSVGINTSKDIDRKGEFCTCYYLTIKKRD